MIGRLRGCFAALLALLPVGVAGGLHGSTAPQAPALVPPGAVVERVTAELVLIETYVTNRVGRPIRGLGLKDFILIVDGAQRPLTSVEFREPPPLEAGGGTAGLAAPLSPSRTPASSFPRRLVLFFEDGTSAPRGLEAARRAADRFLTSGLAPSDQVALAACDRRLRILQDFTTDREALRRAIARSLEDPLRISEFSEEVRSRDEEMRRLLAVPGRHTPGARSSGALPRSGYQGEAAAELQSRLRQAAILAASYASDERPRLARVLGALRTLIDSLAAWPGYRAVVFMGDGILENPAQPYLEQIVALQPDPDLLPDAARHSLAPELEAVARAAAAAGVTVHTLQTIGLGAGGASDLRAARRRSNSLATIALSTGGVSSTSNDLLEALREVDAGSRSYYVLGYAPEGPPDGRHHWVQVRLRDRGRDARLRFRGGFTRLTPAEARGRMLQAAHLLPDLYRDLPADLAIVAGLQGTSGRVTDMVLHLPGEGILFLPEGAAATARLEAGFIALDDSGRETFRAAGRVRLSLGPDEAGAAPPGVNLFCRAVLPASSRTVTAVILDEAAGVVGAARGALASAAAAPGPLAGLSLYSLSERSLWIELPACDARGGDQAAPAAGPALKTRFAPGEPLACGFRAPLAPGERPRPLRIRVLQGGRALIDLEVPAGAQEADGSVTVPLQLESPPPGAYELLVEEENGGRRLVRGRLPFEIGPARGSRGGGSQDS
jgi:VWFA-related protein